jgi:hypothetical protein
MQQQRTSWEYCIVDTLRQTGRVDEALDVIAIYYLPWLTTESNARKQADGIEDIYSGLIDAIEALGRVGWEMCGIVEPHKVAVIDVVQIRYFFKRPTVE